MGSDVMKSPRSVDAEITTSCNLRCAYCSHFSGPGAVDITHDAFRGKGNFTKAIQGIKILQRFKVSVTARVTIHRKNVHELLQLGHMVLGRINHDNLIDIWQNHPDLRNLRERSSIPLTSFAFCRNCPYTDYCTGNCPATAYTITGEVNHPSPDGCLRSFQEQGGSLPEPSLRPQSG